MRSIQLPTGEFVEDLGLVLRYKGLVLGIRYPSWQLFWLPVALEP